MTGNWSDNYFPLTLFTPTTTRNDSSSLLYFMCSMNQVVGCRSRIIFKGNKNRLLIKSKERRNNLAEDESYENLPPPYICGWKGSRETVVSTPPRRRVRRTVCRPDISWSRVQKRNSKSWGSFQHSFEVALTPLSPTDWSFTTKHHHRHSRLEILTLHCQRRCRTWVEFIRDRVSKILDDSTVFPLLDIWTQTTSSLLPVLPNIFIFQTLYKWNVYHLWVICNLPLLLDESLIYLHRSIGTHTYYLVSDLLRKQWL